MVLIINMISIVNPKFNKYIQRIEPIVMRLIQTERMKRGVKAT